MRFVNHGELTAQYVKIVLDKDLINSLPEQGLKDTLLKQREKECIIGVGQHYDFTQLAMSSGGILI